MFTRGENKEFQNRSISTGSLVLWINPAYRIPTIIYVWTKVVIILSMWIH